MISHKKLPGGLDRQTLDGISDWFGMPTWVRSYWTSIKGRINEIIATGLKISQYQQKLGVAHSRLIARDRKDLADQLTDEIAKVNDDLQKWWKVKGYIDKYLPQWVKLDSNEVITQPGSAVLGLVPFVLAGMALTALAYVVNVGMALVQDYAFKSQLTTAIIEGKMTSGQAADILSVPKQEGVFEKVIGTVGVGMGIGIPTALLVGGGIYVMFTTGMLNKIIGSVFGGGRTSSQSSGG